ncbi:MAG TPA: glycosyltransferase 87 family protein [Candidatus Polarisedimenticolia bacterium]|nr:glycosyltransferase 87 family protein [Candidatus Polarisedimenticolia bacterium]
MRRPLVAGLLMEAGFAALAAPGLSVPARVALQLGLFVAYLAALRGIAWQSMDAAQWRAALALAGLFRLTLVVAAPFYSDDLYRYLWDGRVQVTGRLNPYRYAPGDPAVAPLRNEISSRVNHPEIPTIYPPVAQFLFALVAAVRQSAVAIKSALALCDLALLAVLLKLLARTRIPREQLLIYAWNPLVIAEVAGNGHVDVLAVLLLIVAIHLIIGERSLLSTLALGLAAGAKFVPFLAFPVLLRRVPARFRIVPFALFGTVYLPYAGAGAALFGGLRAYAERWRHNDSLFALILAALEFLDPTEVLKAGVGWLHELFSYPRWMLPMYTYAYPAYCARLVALGLVAALALVLVRKKADPIRGTFMILGWALLLSPTVHPWYLLWIAPFLVLRPNPAWILLTGLVPLSYLDPAPVAEGIPRPLWIRLVEYVPFFILLVTGAAISYRRRDPVTLFGLRQFPPGLAGRWPDEAKGEGVPPPA